MYIEIPLVQSISKEKIEQDIITVSENLVPVNPYFYKPWQDKISGMVMVSA